MLKNNKVFRLYAYCQPVLGEERSMICDMQNSAFQEIPNALYEILTEYRDRTVQEIVEHYNDEQGIVADYFEFLYQNGYGFYTDNPELYPEMAIEWDHPEFITATTVCINNVASLPYADLWEQLDQLMCKYLEVYCFQDLSLTQLATLLAPTSTSLLNGVSVLLKYQPDFTPEACLKTLAQLPKVTMLVLYEVPEALLKQFNTQEIASTTESFKSANDFELKPDSTLIINQDFFTEAKYRNPYYNQKVAIDEAGNIKNDLHLEKSFGNIKTHQLAEVINQTDFQELWFAKPDLIEGLQNDHMRYCRLETRPLEKTAQGTWRIIE